VTDFDDLLAANRTFADSFALTGFDGIARAGVAMVTCMDSRIDPLGMIGLQPGDAKILRNPGGRVNDDELVALVLGVHLLQVKRVLVVEHTRCAMASSTEEQIHERVSSSAGTDSTWMSIGPIDDQERQLRADVHRVTSHPLIPDSIDDTGLLQQVV
jgi:carbonic anhydrase